MNRYESDLSVKHFIYRRTMDGPCIVSDKDTEKLKWIYGAFLNGNEINVQLSGCDVKHLFEHLFLNIFNSMFGNPQVGAWMEPNGEEQLWNWRLLNLVIKSNEKLKNEANEIFFDLCEVFDKREDDKILGLFGRYVV